MTKADELRYSHLHGYGTQRDIAQVAVFGGDLGDYECIELSETMSRMIFGDQWAQYSCVFGEIMRVDTHNDELVKYIGYTKNSDADTVWVLRRSQPVSAMSHVVQKLFLLCCFFCFAGPIIGTMLAGFVGAVAGLAVGITLAVLTVPLGHMRLRAYPPYVDGAWARTTHAHWAQVLECEVTGDSATTVDTVFFSRTD